MTLCCDFIQCVNTVADGCDEKGVIIDESGGSGVLPWAY